MMMRKVFPLLALLGLMYCTNTKDEASGLLVGPAAAATGGAYTFYGDVDKTYTTSCGTAGTAFANSTTTSTTSTSASTSSSQKTEQTSYGISSYYVFKNGETMSLKYDYYTTRDTFTYTPQTATTTTCTTNDLTTCTSGGRFTCTTSDNLTCGGTYAFLFKTTLPVMGFQGYSGSVSWSKGFSLSSSNTSVDSVTLTFNMIGLDGSAFTGTVQCSIPQ